VEISFTTFDAYFRFYIFYGVQLAFQPVLSFDFLVMVNHQVIRSLPESRRTSHQAIKRDQDEREMTLISGPEIKIAWMIGDGLEKGFVSWWLDVRKNLEHHAEFTYY